jgi:hypothetical protein
MRYWWRGLTSKTHNRKLSSTVPFKGFSGNFHVQIWLGNFRELLIPLAFFFMLNFKIHNNYSITRSISVFGTWLFEPCVLVTRTQQKTRYQKQIYSVLKSEILQASYDSQNESTSLNIQPKIWKLTKVPSIWSLFLKQFYEKKHKVICQTI